MKTASKEVLSNLCTGDLVLMTRDAFAADKRLSPCCRGSRRIVRALNNYIYKVEDLQTGQKEDVHICWLKFYSCLNKDVIMSHIKQSENLIDRTSTALPCQNDEWTTYRGALEGSTRIRGDSRAIVQSLSRCSGIARTISRKKEPLCRTG